MRVALLSFSPIADDARVRRHADALTEEGHEVEAFGYAGRGPVPSRWGISVVAEERRSAASKALVALRLLPTRAAPGVASLPSFWSFPEHRAMRDAAGRTRFDVFHANDWRTLPIAAALARRWDAAYVYDSHEYGVEENVDSRRWRLLFPPYVRAVEQRFIRGAAFTMTVADGIADLLQRDYDLASRPLVVRNVPPFQLTPERPVGRELEVLYHGALHADRGLEPLVESVARWRPEYSLTIRGRGAPTTESALLALASKVGVSHRVQLVPPVDVSEVVRAASTADIGIHPLAGSSSQIRFALPNKIFEYVMAGLAVCVTDLPEMGSLVHSFDIGRTFASPSPHAISDAVNALTPDRVAHHRRRALEAARTLCWENERETFLAAYEPLVRGRRS